jgi:hypothetical protein
VLSEHICRYLGDAVGTSVKAEPDDGLHSGKQVQTLVPYSRNYFLDALTQSEPLQEVSK